MVYFSGGHLWWDMNASINNSLYVSTLRGWVLVLEHMLNMYNVWYKNDDLVVLVIVNLHLLLTLKDVK